MSGKPFEKGNPGKPKGAKNKVGNEIREKFVGLLESVGIDQLKADLMALKPYERLNAIMSMAEYVTPKLARTQMQHAIPDEISGFEIKVYRGGPDVPPLANSEKDIVM